MAGIFGGLQSLHTDAYDEVLSCPTEFGARIAVSTQNILREEAHLTDVIDPLGGSYYVETLTGQMEEEILRHLAIVQDAGGMYAAVESGLVQRLIGESARRFQAKVESGEETIVGVNAYRVDETADDRPPVQGVDDDAVRTHLAAFAAWKASRSQAAVATAIRAPNSVGHDSTSSYASVWSDCRPPKMHAIACTVTRAMLLSGCWRVRSTPDVWPWNLKRHERGSRAP